MCTRFDRSLNALVFSGFALSSVWRAWQLGLSGRAVGQAFGLLLLAWLCYRYASVGPLRRVLAIVVFLVGWLGTPMLGFLALGALWTLGRTRRVYAERARQRAAEASRESSGQGEADVSGGSELMRSLLVMKVAAQTEGQIRAFNAPFASVYGDGVVPLLMATEAGERGLYVEAGPWDAVKQEQCLKWLACLRTSDREDLEVEIHSDVEVPELVRFYTARTPRVLFELVGLLHVRVFEQEDFGLLNALTLKRLASEYLELECGDGISIAGLEILDKLVVDVLRADGCGHMLPSTVLLLGSFFGEALIRVYGGRWDVRGVTTGDVSVEIRSAGGTLNANVFGKVLKLFENGIEDSTCWMARAIGERLKGERARA